MKFANTRNSGQVTLYSQNQMTILVVEDVQFKFPRVFVVIVCCEQGFIKGQAPGKLTGCECDFAQLLNISKNFF